MTEALPAPGATARERAVELDVLRGASALAVIVLHAASGPLTEEAALGHASWVLLVSNVTARFAVPVFMILSGMGLTLSGHRDESYLRFLWRRLSSIVPEYVVWSLIYMWLVPHDEALSVRTVLTNLVTGHASRHLYFVPAVVRLYVLYPVLSYFARGPWGVAGCCVFSWSMIWLSPILPDTALGAFVDELLPLRWLGYFVLGIWLANARTPNNSALARAQTLAAPVALAALGCMIAIVRCGIAQSADIEEALGAAEPLVFPYSVALLLWWTGVAFGEGRFVRFLTFVSKHSYAVYLSHMLMLHASVLSLQAAVTQPTHLMTFATGVVFGIPLALATAVLSDRAKRAYRALSATAQE